MRQYCIFVSNDFSIAILSTTLEQFITTLHSKFKPKTVKRKIASLKAFFHYLEYKEIISCNPFNKLQIKFREPQKLPKTIPIHTIESFSLLSINNWIIAKQILKENVLFATLL